MNRLRNRIIIFCLMVVMSLSVLLMYGCGGTEFITIEDIGNDDIELTIYAFTGESESIPLLMNLGHAFVSVANNSDDDIKVGNYTIASGGEASIGTWGQSSHWGVWYNLESTYMSLGRYVGVHSITQSITSSELDTVTDYILDNDIWTGTYNCSAFAMGLWNSIATPDEQINVTGIKTPEGLSKVIDASVGGQIDRKINNYGIVGYQGTSEFIEHTLVE